MKKLISLVLSAVIAISLAACSGTSGTSGNQDTTSGGNSTSEDSNTAVDSTANSNDEVDETASFPLVFEPKWSLKDVKNEDNPDGTLVSSFGGFAYDPKAEIVLEYCKATDDLFTAINGYSDWPTELDDTWRGYGYVGIDNTETASIRTLAVGKFNEKHASIIRDYESALYKSGFPIDDQINGTPEEEGKQYVNYCMLTAKGEVTINQIATAAYNALYLQAWHLVPADKQGVLISANGKTYTVNDILKELAG